MMLGEYALPDFASNEGAGSAARASDPASEPASDTAPELASEPSALTADPAAAPAPNLAVVPPIMVLTRIGRSYPLPAIHPQSIRDIDATIPHDTPEAQMVLADVRQAFYRARIPDDDVSGHQLGLRDTFTVIGANVVLSANDYKTSYVNLSVRDSRGQVQMLRHLCPRRAEQRIAGWNVMHILSGINAAQIEEVQDIHDEEHAGLSTALLRIVTGIRTQIGYKFTGQIAFRADGTCYMHSLSQPDIPEKQAPFILPTPKIDRREAPFKFDVEVGGNQGPKITISVDGTRIGELNIPNKDFVSDPYEWRYVECFANLPAKLIASSWKEGRDDAEGERNFSPFVRATLQELREMFGEDPWPFIAGRGPDWPAIHRRIVQSRYRIGRLPHVFGGRAPHEVVERIWENMLALGESCPLFQLSAGSAEDSVDTDGVLVELIDSTGRDGLRTINSANDMQAFIQRVVTFSQPGRGYVFLPLPICLMALKKPPKALRRIQGISRVPTMRPDGSINLERGYDPLTEMWNSPEVEVPEVPAVPTTEDCTTAYNYMIAMIDQFPFDGHGSRDACLSLIIDAVARPLYRGPRPLYSFEAEPLGQGTGKTLLVQAISNVVCGRNAITPWPEDPKELPKLITSTLLQGSPFVIFDNVEETVRAKDLAALTTSRSWTSRLLGTNKAQCFPNNTVWALTHNGATFSRDIARRVCAIKLEAKTSNAFTRTNFRIPNLLDYALENRGRILWAALVLTRSWFQAGRPADPNLVVGSFEGWCSVVGGILRNAHFMDLHKSFAASRAKDVDGDEHTQFVVAWAHKWGGHPVNPTTLATLCDEIGVYEKVTNSSSAVWRGRHLSNIVTRLVGHDFGGYRVTFGPRQHNSPTFQLTLAPAQTVVDMSASGHRVLINVTAPPPVPVPVIPGRLVVAVESQAHVVAPGVAAPVAPTSTVPARSERIKTLLEKMAAATALGIDARDYNIDNGVFSALTADQERGQLGSFAPEHEQDVVALTDFLRADFARRAPLLARNMLNAEPLLEARMKLMQSSGNA